MGGVEEVYVGENAEYSTKKAPNSVTKAIHGAYMNLIAEWENTDDSNLKRLYKADASDWKTIDDFAKEGNHDAAKKAYSEMDTASRDALDKEHLNKQTAEEVAEYFGFEWNIRFNEDCGYSHEDEEAEAVFKCKYCDQQIANSEYVDHLAGDHPEELIAAVQDNRSQEQRPEFGGDTGRDADDGHEDEEDQALKGGEDGLGPDGDGRHDRDTSEYYPEDEEVEKFKSALSKGQHVEYNGETYAVAVPDAQADFVGIALVGEEDDEDAVKMVRARKLMKAEDEEPIVMDIKMEGAQVATVWDYNVDDKDESPESPKDPTQVVKLPPKVKSALTKEIKQLTAEAKKIEGRDEARAIFYNNCAAAQQELLDHLSKENVDGLKWAQVCLGKYMSPIVQRIPNVAYKFITGGGQPAKLKDLFVDAKAKNEIS